MFTKYGCNFLLTTYLPLCTFILHLSALDTCVAHLSCTYRCRCVLLGLLSISGFPLFWHHTLTFLYKTLHNYSRLLLYGTIFHSHCKTFFKTLYNFFSRLLLYIHFPVTVENSRDFARPYTIFQEYHHLFSSLQLTIQYFFWSHWQVQVFFKT